MAKKKIDMFMFDEVRALAKFLEPEKND